MILRIRLFLSGLPYMASEPARPRRVDAPEQMKDAGMPLLVL
jgi:hypothetical protein